MARHGGFFAIFRCGVECRLYLSRVVRLGSLSHKLSCGHCTDAPVYAFSPRVGTDIGDDSCADATIPGRDDKVLGQVDIYPTLLNLLGLDEYQWKGQGNSVFSPHKPPFAIVTMTGEIVGDTTSLPPPPLLGL